jgi:hypothetical protein
MKTSTGLILASLTLALLTPVRAQRTIAQWNFNDTNAVAASFGSGEFTTLGPVALQFFSGSPGDPAGANYALGLSGFPEQNTGRRTAGVQFNAGTLGFNNVKLTFDFRGSATASRKLAVLYTVNGTDFLDASSFLITTDGVYTTGLTVLELASLPGTANNPNFAFRIVSDFTDDTAYTAIKAGSTYAPAGTWRFDLVTLSGQPIGGGTYAPRILLQPEDRSALLGATTTFAVVADGTEPLEYQWMHATTNLSGATTPTLTLSSIKADAAGLYRVLIQNPAGQVTSRDATLAVTEKPGPIVTNIAYLHTLIDPASFLPTDTTNLYTVEGVSTTWTNLTTVGNSLFYIQDDTAGICVFVSGGASKFPPAGGRVRVTGPLGHFNGLLEFNMVASNTNHSWTLLSTNNPLPKPLPLEFAWANDPALIENHEGRYVVASNVWIDLTLPNFVSGTTVNITNELGETFTLRVDARPDIAGQPKPKTPVTIYGVISQFDTSDPRSSGYQLMPSRFADIVSALKAPTVRFTNVLANLVRPGDTPTNSYPDIALNPTESLRITVAISDPEGRPVQVSPLTAGMPEDAAWSFSSLTGTLVTGTFDFQPTGDNAGHLYPVTLLAWNVVATNAAIWNIYVPSALEQKIVLTEYLANPTASTNAAFYNPLRRDPPTPNTSQHDEYLELVNLSDTDADLLGWTIADAVGIRHRFYDSFMIGSSNAVIVYGGPLSDLFPSLDVPSIPASESSAGLALNNDGDTLIIRNADGNLVHRLVYTAAMVSTNGSMTRYPTANSPFVPQTAVSTNTVTPGLQYDGRLWSLPPVVPPTPAQNLTAAVDATGHIALTWSAESGRRYTVWSATTVTGPYVQTAVNLTTGQYVDPNRLLSARFYRVSTQ